MPHDTTKGVLATMRARCALIIDISHTHDSTIATTHKDASLKDKIPSAFMDGLLLEFVPPSLTAPPTSPRPARRQHDLHSSSQPSQKAANAHTPC